MLEVLQSNARTFRRERRGDAFQMLLVFQRLWDETLKNSNRLLTFLICGQKKTREENESNFSFDECFKRSANSHGQEKQQEGSDPTDNWTLHGIRR